MLLLMIATGNWFQFTPSCVTIVTYHELMICLCKLYIDVVHDRIQVSVGTMLQFASSIECRQDERSDTALSQTDFVGCCNCNCSLQTASVMQLSPLTLEGCGLADCYHITNGELAFYQHIICTNDSAPVPL